MVYLFQVASLDIFLDMTKKYYKKVTKNSKIVTFRAQFNIFCQ